MLPTCICTTRSVGKRMLATFSGVKSFEFAKFINMRKYAANIRQHGMVAMADTGPREAYIKFIRRAWLLTNRQPGTVDQQVATKVHFLEALQSAIDSIKQATARPPKGSGALQRAKAAWSPSMLQASGDTFTFAKMKQEGTWEARVFEAAPALSHLPAALQVFLQADSAPAAVEIQKTIGLPRYEGVADVIHIHPAFYNRTKACLVPDSVAFNAWGTDREGEDVQDTWYGQVSTLCACPRGTPCCSCCACHQRDGIVINVIEQCTFVEHVAPSHHRCAQEHNAAPPNT
eukprot:GHRQ01038842.1.p1 GENE.GHRQ01038842.1~~GHRQ01038842.1.p1  ORF type:complete len:288 (+),score=51.93 GHRQ01038842.1:17-880(+)